MASLQYLRRLAPAALLAATAVLGGSAIGDPPTACAAPKELDIGQYDKCTDQVDKDVVNELIEWEELEAEYAKCCANAGGTWNKSRKSCDAPAAAESQPGRPGVAPPPGVATQPPPPPPPPVRNPGMAPRPGVIETFTPAPIG
jgi:hypothetical protein